MREFRPVSRLLDNQIVDRRGVTVGWVRELLIDPYDGRIEYVRIALQTPQSEPLAYLTVPWSAVQLESGDSQRWQLAVRRDTVVKLARIESFREELLTNSYSGDP